MCVHRVLQWQKRKLSGRPPRDPADTKRPSPGGDGEITVENIPTNEVVLEDDTVSMRVRFHTPVDSENYEYMVFTVRQVF